MVFHRLDLVCYGLESLDGMKELSGRSFVAVNLRGNHLSDFDGLGTHPYMVQLDVRGNNIMSFYGLTRQRSLQSLELEGNPVTSHPLYRVMALMVVGFSIVEIDGLPVTPEERALARRAGTDAAMAVSFGWLMDMRPRTLEAFKGIIAESRRIHSRSTSKAGSGKPRRSVAEALRELESGAVPATPAAGAALQDHLRVQELEAEESKRTIARLSKRVATLEQLLREASVGTAAAETVLLLGQRCNDPLFLKESTQTSTEPNTALSDRELQQASSIVFASGISTRHNQGGQGQPPRRSCLQLSRRSLTVLNFMTRSPTFELQLSGSVVVQYRPPKTLLMENRFGVGLEVTFDDCDVLRTVFKLVFLLRSKPVPVLPTCEDAAGDSEGQWGRQRDSDAGSREPSVSESEGEAPLPGPTQPPARSVVGRPAHGRPEPTARPRQPAIAAGSAAPPRPAHMTKAAQLSVTVDDTEMDYIPDVPPLPSPGGGSSALRSESQRSRPAEPARESVESRGAPRRGVGSASTDAGFEAQFAMESNVDPNEGVANPIMTAAPSAAALLAPSVQPSVPVSRFQALRLSSSASGGVGSDSGGGAAAEAPAVARRRDSTANSFGGSVASAPPSVPASAPVRKGPPPAPPTVPPRRAPAGSPAPLISSDAPTHAPAAPARGKPPPMMPSESVDGLSSALLSTRHEDRAADGAAANDAPRPQPQPLVRSPADADSGANGLNSAAQPRAAAAVAPVAVRRFAWLMVDSDSDSDQ